MSESLIMVINKCYQCVFWKRDKFREDVSADIDCQIGLCRRHPPTVFFDNDLFIVESSMPDVLAGDWCGEFKLSDMPDVWLDDSLDFFLRDFLDFIRVDHEMSRDDFYLKYWEWCAANKYLAINEFLFTKQLGGLGIYLFGEYGDVQHYEFGIKDTFADEYLSFGVLNGA